jgi:hypothetical protein
MGRKKPHIHYIYKTTCNVTKRYYIGMHSTSNLEDGYLGSGKRLRYSIRRYGKENHTKEILEFLPTREKLVIREFEIIDNNLLNDVLCINLRPGGQGGFISEEQQRHRSICAGNAFAKKYKEDENFRKEVIRKRNIGVVKNHKQGKYNYNTFEGKTHSEETKLLISQVKKNTGVGDNNSQFGTCWITNEIENKKIHKGDPIPKGWRLGRKIK